MNCQDYCRSSRCVCYLEAYPRLHLRPGLRQSHIHKNAKITVRPLTADTQVKKHALNLISNDTDLKSCCYIVFQEML